jgi:hypothetical protein
MYASTFGLDYWKAATDYWRAPGERSWILVNPASIGDTWLTCALARAFRQTHGGPLTMVFKESQKAIAEMFEADIDRIILWDDDRLLRFCLRLRGFGHFDIDEPIIAHPAWHGTGRSIFPLMELLRYPGRGGLTFADQWRLMLRLDWDTSLVRPVIPDVWRAEAAAQANAAGVIPGESVILFPDNNTNPQIDDRLWIALARRFAARGVAAFTNMAGNASGRRSAPLAGTRPIDISIRHSIPLVELAGHFVSMSNGTQALLMGSGVSARHSFLINAAGAGKEWGGLGYPVKDLLIQSFRCVGIADGPFYEYLVDAEHIDDDLLDAIVDHRIASNFSFLRPKTTAGRP